MKSPFGTHVRDVRTIIEDLLSEPLELGLYRDANAQHRYRAIEVGDVRYGWTVPPYPRPASTGGMAPQHFALTLRLSPTGDWRVEALKPFEWADDAERWAHGLWRDATRGAAAPGVGTRPRHDTREG